MNIAKLLRQKDVTEQFNDLFFPSKAMINRVDPEIPYGNNIIFYNVIVFGYPATGKTTLVNSLVGYARDKYGNKDVTALFSEKGNLDTLMENFEPKLVNILYTDNATMAEYKKETLHRYFMLRNITHDKFGISNCYILSIIALHRYFAVPVSFRTIIDGIIMRDISLNPYDNAVLKKFVDNDKLYDLLAELSVRRLRERNLMNYSIFVGKTFKGIVCIPPRKEFYLETVRPANPLMLGYRRQAPWYDPEIARAIERMF